MHHVAAAQAGEVEFRAIRACTVYTVTVLVVDPPHGEAGM
jgi:hypothetical protein